MKNVSFEKPSAYLCPRIIGVESRYIYYGGDQAWYPRNTAYKGGCAPVCASNILAVLVDKFKQFQENFQLHIDDEHFVSQDEYLALMQKLYKFMHLREVPVLNAIYDGTSRSNKLFSYLPTNLGTDISAFTRNVIKYALKHDVYLQYRSLSTPYCGYIRGLTFIKMALANGYPIALTITNRKVYCNLMDRPYMQTGSPRKIKKHFVTITDIKESSDSGSPILTITTWGKTGTIAYTDLYKSWQSPLAFGSAMVYFTPTKSIHATKRALIQSYGILFKR